jgi:hypothetical protein
VNPIVARRHIVRLVRDQFSHPDPLDDLSNHALPLDRDVPGGAEFQVDAAADTMIP